MKILFHLGHPAHYHLFKNAIQHFKQSGSEVHVLIKKKDVLEDLLEQEHVPYKNIFPKTRGSSVLSMTRTILNRNYKLFKFCLKHKPDILAGTSVECSHIGGLLNIPFINLNEDDYNVVPYYSKLSYPLSSTILAPVSCKTGKWEKKTIHYKSFHELAYLHPNNFRPDVRVAKKYVNASDPYFVIRFAKLTAHHDQGITGLNKEIASKLIQQLFPYGNIYITSEKPLEREFETFRLNIKPADMHHVLAYANLYIGDSQTMAAEAGVLGTPFVRFNDFVGRIGYLNELERKYKLGFGIKTSQKEKLLRTVQELVKNENTLEMFASRRVKMLNEKIDLNQLLIWFIKNYPLSKDVLTIDPEYQSTFGSRVLSRTIHNNDIRHIKTTTRQYNMQYL